MSVALLEDLSFARASGNRLRVQEIATQALAALSPSGLLEKIAVQAEADRKFSELAAEFKADEAALAYLDHESFLDRIEDDFALVVPLIAQAANPVLAWAIPLLSALAGPASPFLSFGLQVACKIALAALEAWAKKRVLNIPKAV